MVGHCSLRPVGQGLHLINQGRPKEVHEVRMEIVIARRILNGAPLLQTFSSISSSSNSNTRSNKLDNVKTNLQEKKIHHCESSHL